jgi:hypothetical protein
MTLYTHECTHGFSSNPQLLLNVVTRDQAISIANTLGREKLENWNSYSWRLSNYNEKDALEELRNAIEKVTGISKSWIIGYAFEFAACLLTFI